MTKPYRPQFRHWLITGLGILLIGWAALSRLGAQDQADDKPRAATSTLTHATIPEVEDLKKQLAASQAENKALRQQYAALDAWDQKITQALNACLGPRPQLPPETKP